MIEIFSNKQDKSVAFFPRSLRMFQINNEMKSLIKLINQGKSSEYICSKLTISKEEYSKLKKTLTDYDTSPKIDPRRIIPENILKRLSINISNDCNMRCDYCYASFGCYGDKSNLMDISMIKLTLDKFYSLYDEIAILQVFGGEPFLNYEGFKFICEYIHEKYQKGEINFLTQINTVSNGTIMTKKIIRLIKDFKINVTISLDGPKKIHDTNRPFINEQGTFDTIFKNIKKLKKETNQPSQIEVTYNQHHIENDYSVIQLIEYFDQYFKDISLHIAPVSGNKEECFVLQDRQTFIDSVEPLIAKGRKSSYVILDDMLDSLNHPIERDNYCDAGTDLISVSSKGDIYPCYMFIGEKSFSVMNIQDDNFSKETLLKKLQKYKNYSRTTDRNTYCGTCFAVNACTGCIGLNYYNTGDIHRPSKDDCSMRREMLKKIILNV